MKQTRIIIAGLSLVIGLGLNSCNKEGCTDPTATNYDSNAEKDDGSCEFAPNVPTVTTPGAYTPSFAGEFGALIAIKTLSTTDSPIGPMDMEIGTAVAVFSQNSGAAYVSAGTVSVDSEVLSMQDNKSYVYMIDFTKPTGLDFGSTVSWEGTGSTWEAFATSTSQGFAGVNPITSGDVSKGSDYTLTSGYVANADSILYAVYGPSGSKMMMVGANTTSYTFSASDLSGLGEGSGFTQVVGLNYDKQVIGGKDYWLINESVRTKQIKITQ